MWKYVGQITVMWGKADRIIFFCREKKCGRIWTKMGGNAKMMRTKKPGENGENCAEICGKPKKMRENADRILPRPLASPTPRGHQRLKRPGHSRVRSARRLWRTAPLAYATWVPELIQMPRPQMQPRCPREGSRVTLDKQITMHNAREETKRNNKILNPKKIQPNPKKIQKYDPKKN